MTRSRFVSWLPLTAVLVLAAITVVGLMFGVAGDRKGMIPLGANPDSRVDIFIDPVAGLTFAEALGMPDKAWTDWSNQDYLRCEHGEAMWVRVILKNPHSRPQRGVIADIELFTDQIDLWTHDETWPDGWRHERAGEWVPAGEKSLWGRDAAFFIEVPARGQRVVYLRVQDHFGVWMQPAWWPDQRAFLAAQLRDTLAEAAYFGVLLALFVYNGVLWTRLRHRDFGYYLGYLAMFAVFMFMYRTEHLVLGFALGSPIAEAVAGFALAASGFFLVKFARVFLELRTLVPRADRVARVLRSFTAVQAVAALTFPWTNNTLLLHVTVAGATLTHLVLVIAAIFAWRAGSYYARFFVFSFGLLLVVMIPNATIWLLGLPLGISTLALMVGSALEVMMLSLALSDRLARLQQENIASKLAAEKARLELLRYQLNPHFLFNALNSIYGLVYPHSRVAGDVVRRLADFCRSSFAHDGDHPTTLGEEITIMRAYLDIEQVRWRERLVIEYDLDAALDAVRLPPFLLLPLVENAIKHGGATSPGVLTLRVGTRACGHNTLEIVITNTGRWQTRDEPRTVSSTGVGLENLRARLASSFHGRHQFEISGCDGWVTAILRLKLPNP